MLAAIRKGAEFIVVLDLAKAYNNVINTVMRRKLRENIDSNLTNQLTIFLMTVYAQVTSDLSNTVIEMLRGLTQGGTWSPALFRVSINDLPKEVREALYELSGEMKALDPIRLVADDVIVITYMLA